MLSAILHRKGLQEPFAFLLEEIISILKIVNITSFKMIKLQYTEGFQIFASISAAAAIID